MVVLERVEGIHQDVARDEVFQLREEIGESRSIFPGAEELREDRGKNN